MSMLYNIAKSVSVVIPRCMGIVCSLSSAFPAKSAQKLIDIDILLSAWNYSRMFWKENDVTSFPVVRLFNDWVACASPS